MSRGRDPKDALSRHSRTPMTEKILIASDHAGFELKEKLEHALEDLGFDVQDLGTNTSESTDYADYAHPLAEKVSTGEVKRGVLLCGTGLGMSYTANRYPHVRAAVAWNAEIAKLAREHNDACLLYTSDAADERSSVDLGGRRIIK